MKHPIRPAKVVKAAKRGHAGRLEDWVAIEENVQLGDRVYLSPDWLESVMQWPIMWSASTPLETAKFQQWLQQHGISWRRPHDFFQLNSAGDVPTSPTSHVPRAIGKQV
jgi:hypothetical protein